MSQAAVLLFVRFALWRLLYHQVRDGLTDPDTGDLPGLIIQALQVLNVHPGQNVNTPIKQHLNVFPAFGAVRTGNIVC